MITSGATNLLQQLKLRSSNPNAGLSGTDIGYFPNLGFVFVFVSKNASSYLKGFLGAREQKMKFSKAFSVNPHREDRKLFLTPGVLGWPEMSKLLLDDHVPKISLVRHPQDRFESAFRSRVTQWTKEAYQKPGLDGQWTGLRQQILGHKIYGVPAARHLALSEDISLIDVVNFVEATPDAFLDRHLAPQHYLLAPELIRYHRLGKMEELEVFVNRLAEDFGFPPPNDEERNPVNSSHQIVERRAPKRQFAKRIRSRYSADYQLFGYR